ncbi:MAG: hypothetical protein ABI760_15830 [Ferruginibacter sp.]
MTSTFKILFSIDLLNEYYTSLQCMDFNVVPSAETALLLKNYKMLYKFTGNKLVALVKVNDLDEPFAGIDIDKKFVFYLTLLQPVFMNITNLDLDNMGSRRFYFTNLNQNKAGSSLYLTNKIDDYIPTYRNADTYEPGNLVTNVDGVVFECIQASTGGHNTANRAFWKPTGNFQYISNYNNTAFYAPDSLVNDGAGFIFKCIRETTGGHTTTDITYWEPQGNFLYRPGGLVDDGTGAIFECIQSTKAGKNDTTKDAFWIEKGEFQYVSVKDMYPFVTNIYNYQTIIEANVFSIFVYGLNKTTGVYDLEITIDKNRIETIELTNNVQFDLSQLPAGRYRLIINTDEPVDVYLDNVAVYGNFLGVIEIFTHLGNTNEFGLLDVNGKVKDSIVAGNPVWLQYSIRFGNRLAFWKYFTPKHGVNNITDPPLVTSGYSFIQAPELPAKPDYFLSNIPIPLIEKPILFNLELSSTTDPSLAPNPNPQVTGMLTKNADNFYCNIYLNY